MITLERERFLYSELALLRDEMAALKSNVYELAATTADLESQARINKARIDCNIEFLHGTASLSITKEEALRQASADERGRIDTLNAQAAADIAKAFLAAGEAKK